MRVCFLNDGNIKAILPCEEEKVAVYLCGFAGLEAVSYEKELKGQTNFFEETALLSKAQKTLVLRGCITDTRGYKRQSVVVAENGRLKGVSDMLNVMDGEMSSGAALRLYETEIGRIGIVVSEDLAFPELFKSLALCGADYIACLFSGRAENVQRALLCANAYCFGVPILYCANGYSMVANVAGEIEFASPQNQAFYDLKTVKEYHVIETRSRGCYRTQKRT
jgi:predicted amidohydrolase